MHNINKKLSDFLYAQNKALPVNCINNIDFYFLYQNKVLIIYFPHIFIYNWFLYYNKDNLNSFIKNEFPEIKDIAYKYRNRKSDLILNYYKYNHKYTFDNFYYNQKNYISYFTTKQLTNYLNENFIPFIITGEKGSGKTHLSHSIANRLLEQDPYYKILFTNPHLLNRSLNSFHNKREFREYISNYDCYIIDDFHDIKEFKDLHNEIIQLLDHCIKKFKYYIINIDNHLFNFRNIKKDLKFIKDKGLKIYLNEPDIDIKTKFIHKFCIENRLSLTDDNILYIANSLNNLKEIKYTLNNLNEYKEHLNKDCYEINNLINICIKNNYNKLTTEEILKEICDFFEISKSHLLSTTKIRNIVLARQLGMLLCRNLLGLSYSKIGQVFGNKDHSTVQYSINKVLKLKENNSEINGIVQILEKKCSQLA